MDKVVRTGSGIERAVNMLQRYMSQKNIFRIFIVESGYLHAAENDAVQLGMVFECFPCSQCECLASYSVLFKEIYESCLAWHFALNHNSQQLNHVLYGGYPVSVGSLGVSFPKWCFVPWFGSRFRTCAQTYFDNADSTPPVDHENSNTMPQSARIPNEVIFFVKRLNPLQSHSIDLITRQIT